MSDWSGVAFEYALGLKKPVIFVDVPRKVNNQKYKEIQIDPIEVIIREHMGVVWDRKYPISDALDKCQNFDRNKLDLLLKEIAFDIENGYAEFMSYIGKVMDNNAQELSKF